MPRTIGPDTSVENLKKEAKGRLKALHAADPAATIGLRDVQYVLAREFGHESWTALTHAIEAGPHERAAGDLLLAFNNRDEAALQRLNAHDARSFNSCRSSTTTRD